MVSGSRSLASRTGPGKGRMFVEQMRAAVTRAPREKCAELARAVWKAYAAGAIGDDDAQALAEAVEARKAVPAMTPAPRRVGSRPRSPESTERRRRWVACGLIPPQIACRFTMGEGAALAVIAAEVAKRGRCTLTVGHIAALAGVCKTTVRNAIRQAAGLGLVRSEEWRLSAFRSAPNTVTITSAEWLAWLRLGGRVQNREVHAYASTYPPKIERVGTKESDEKETARSRPAPHASSRWNGGSKPDWRKPRPPATPDGP